VRRDKIIGEAIDMITSQTPSIIPRVPEVAGIVYTDLHQGPVYLGPDGEICEHADAGAVPFDFKSAIEIIREWKGELPTLYIDEDSCASEVNPFDDPENYESVGGGASIYLGPEIVYEVGPTELVSIILGEAISESV